MPFTPAHPAIVLPLLKKRYASATGLIVGSVSPDFEYFFKASVSGVHGHNLYGLFYFDLPVSLVIALVFHWLIKESLIANLPAFLQSRLSDLNTFDFFGYLKEHFFLFIFSVLIGASSHIFWDSFTHNGRFFVETFPILRTAYIPLDGAKYPLWYALQHISTAVGLVLILLYIVYKQESKDIKVQPIKFGYWLAILLLGAMLFALRFIFFKARFEIGNVVVTAMSMLMLAMCLVSPIRYFKPLSQNN